MRSSCLSQVCHSAGRAFLCLRVSGTHSLQYQQQATEMLKQGGDAVVTLAAVRSAV